MRNLAEHPFYEERPIYDFDTPIDPTELIRQRFGKTLDEMTHFEVEDALKQVTEGDRADAA